MHNNNGDSPRYSAKVLALLGNLLNAHTPTNDVNENYILAKRYVYKYASLQSMLTKPSVVFSHSTRMLDLIQPAFSHY
jgi:hypothetical protein